jgi:FkbM family methyltransferase
MTWLELLHAELPPGWPRLGPCPGVEPAHRWARALARGRTVLDVGCHVGLTSAACLRGGALAVHGLDPNREALVEAVDLVHHLRLLGLATYPLLAAEQCAPVGPWWRDPMGSQTGSSRRAVMSRLPEIAPMTTLDCFCATRQIRPGLVLVDVEGYEAEVLAGSQHLLDAVRPRWIVELHGGAPGGVLGRLREAGYRVHQLASDGTLQEPDPAGWTGSGCVGWLVALPAGDDGGTLEPGG